MPVPENLRPLMEQLRDSLAAEDYDIALKDAEECGHQTFRMGLALDTRSFDDANFSAAYERGWFAEANK